MNLSLFVFLHVVRDPLDALASLKEIGFNKTVPEKFADKVHLLKTFRHAGETYVAEHPNTSLTIHYETLVQSTHGMLQNIFSYLGEKFEQEVLQKFNLPERGNGIEDPKVRMTDKVHLNSIGRWRKDLKKKEVLTACRILGLTTE